MNLTYLFNVIRSSVIWILVGGITFFLFFIVLLNFIVILPFDRDRKALHPLISVWAILILMVCPVMRVKLELESKLSRKKPYIFVANHQSLADILAILHFDHPFKFVAKRELFLIPFFGWGLWMAGYIPLTRGDHNSGRKVLEQAACYLKRGVSVLLFPEGTRSPNGEIQNFKVGAFKLSNDFQVPIVPIVINGTHNLLPKGSRFFGNKRADVTVHIGKPRLCTSSNGSHTTQFIDDVRNEMVGKLAQMRRS